MSICILGPENDNAEGWMYHECFAAWGQAKEGEMFPFMLNSLLMNNSNAMPNVEDKHIYQKTEVLY